jgi:L-ascorbate metabolism protein UlaG (beta-lactamase superfamily)
MKAFGSKASGLRLERMKASPRWEDGSFRNVHPILPGLKQPLAMPTIGEFLCPGGRKVPAGPLPSNDPRAAWTRPVETSLRATWLGHSTVLLEIDGVRLLTDPVWGRRASPSSLVGPKRFQPVPVAISELPPVDAVLVSHDHYDHLDYPTIRALAKIDVPFITSLGVGAHLEAWGVPAARITELDWWESAIVPRSEVRVAATPSQHFSGRRVGDRNATLWSSFSVNGPTRSIFFSGDTGLTAEYGDIRERFGPFDLVMLEVGAFHPAWGDIHLGPVHALEALELLGGGAFLPVHWGTFMLATHEWDEPAETLLALGPKKGAHLVLPRLGEPVEPSRVESLEPWWREVAALENRAGAPTDDAAEPVETLQESVGFPMD